MKQLLQVFLAVIIGFVLFSQNTSAQSVNNFVINDFAGRYELFNDINGGRMLVTETIELTFSAQNHGILRAIPENYQGDSLKLAILSVGRDGKKEPYTTYDDNGNQVLKIGNKNQTITGAHTYEIKYEMRNVIRFFETHNEFFWDINGDQWSQPFEHVSAEIVLPASNGTLSIPEPVCYTGNFGGIDNNCQIEKTENGWIFETNKQLNANETLTVVVGTSVGTFQPRTWNDWAREHALDVVGFFVYPLLVLLPAYKYWRRKGKDIKGRGIIVPEYQAPEGILPCEAGAIADYRVDDRDISATIIDLAIKGYIRIIETKKNRKLLPDSLNYEFELINIDTTNLKPYEIEILRGIFGKNSLVESSIGNTVKVSSLKSRFYETVAEVRRNVSSSLTSEGYFTMNPIWASGKLMAVFVIGLVFLPFVSGITIGLLFGGLLTLPLVLVLALFMRKRTQKGVEARDYIEGLKMYLSVAEKDRLEKMQGPDAAYSIQKNLPKKTVDLYEKLLPYAIVLQVEQEWSKQFKDIYKNPPDWYGGNWNSFNSLVLSNSLSSSLNEMSANFSPPSSSGSGSSGFSGGGSSGGGGGGGGGGW